MECRAYENEDEVLPSEIFKERNAMTTEHDKTGKQEKYAEIKIKNMKTAKEVKLNQNIGVHAAKAACTPEAQGLK